MRAAHAALLVIAWASPAAAQSSRPAAGEVVPTGVYDAPAPGRVALRVESAGTPQHVVVERRVTPGSAWERTYPGRIFGAAHCDTPCLLYVPPGVLRMRASGESLRNTDFDFTMPEDATGIRLRAPSRALYNVGTGIAAAGGAVILASAVVAFALSQAPRGEGLPDTVFLGLTLFGAGLLVAGLPMMLTNRTGVSTQWSLR